MMIDEITLQKLRKSVLFAYHNSRFYHELYMRAGINVKTCCLPESLPYVSPEDIVNYSMKIRANIPLYRVCASSGTKNIPKLLFRSQNDFNISALNQIKLMEWCGLDKSDIVGIVQPSGLWGYAELTQEAARQMGILTIQLGNAEDMMALKLIHELGVTVLDIAPSRLNCLLKLADNLGCKLQKVRIAMCSGEKLNYDLRQYAWERFQIKIFNQYGSEETDALGGEMSPDKGIYLLQGSFFYEVRKNDGEYARNGEIGTLVVTSFYHQGTPLIRYQLGDRVKIISQEKGIVEILGRGEDYVVLYDSVKLHVSQLQLILDIYLREPNIWQARIQSNNGKIEIVICIQEGISEEKKQNILDELTRTSIDIHELWRNGILSFSIRQGGFKRTGRGKQIQLLDERNRER